MLAIIASANLVAAPLDEIQPDEAFVEEVVQLDELEELTRRKEIVIDDSQDDFYSDLEEEE